MGILKNLKDSNPEIRRNAIRRMVKIPAAWIFIALLLVIDTLQKCRVFILKGIDLEFTPGITM